MADITVFVAARCERWTTRPIVVWHRGYHSLAVNDACLRWMELDAPAMMATACEPAKPRSRSG